MDVVRPFEKDDENVPEPLPLCPKCNANLTMGEWMGGLCLTCGNVIP